MRLRIFANRVLKEIGRDILSVVFGIGFPVVLLILLWVINRNIPAEAQMTLFELNNLVPGVTVFGLSFLALFGGMVVAKDRTGAFLARLFTTPMKSSDFILGYTLPLIPVALLQAVICYALGLALGLEFTPNLFLALICILPTALVYISLGLIFGTLFNDKQVGSICGALLTNVSALLSNIWFDLSLIGSGVHKFASLLPFLHGVELCRTALRGDFSAMLPHLLNVCLWAIVLLSLAILLFRRAMRTK